MKFICLGYLDVDAWSKLPPDEQNTMIDRCLAYDETLKKDGHWAGGEGLAGPDQTATLRWQKGKAEVGAGPYAATKDLRGGLLVLEAGDRDEAIRLIANHPGLQMGPWEILPVEDITPMIRESEKRRGITRSRHPMTAAASTAKR